MRSTTRLVAAAVAAAVLFSLHGVHAEEEAEGSGVPIEAADHLGTLRYALVIGIDDYADKRIPDLSNREANARGVHAVLVDPHTGGVPEANAQLLLGTEATAAKIRMALDGLQDLPKEATVLVYFAGHGATQGENAYWVAQDSKRANLRASAVPAAEVQRLLGRAPAERVLLMMDCRHVAGLVGDKTARVDHAAVLARYHGTGYAALGAAGREETSIDSDGVDRSIFTHFLVEGLSGAAEDDADGIVTLSELVDYVGRQVRSETRKRGRLERPVADLEGVREPSRLLLTVEQESLAERLLEDQPAQARRRERLAALTALHGDGRITTEQDRLGRLLLGALPDGFEPHELEQRVMFVDLAEGRLAPEHLTSALVAIGRADRRTLVVPDEFKTIQAGIDAARAGDTVFVKEGLYDEHLLLKNGLRLSGEGRERTVVRMVPGEKEILLAQDCAWGVIEGLQFDGTGGRKIGDWSPDGIHLKGSSVRVRACVAHSCLGAGLYASGVGCRPYVLDSRFEKNAQDGMCFSGADGGVIAECICRSNGAVGIQVRQSLGAVAVRDCQAEFNVHGIGVSSGSTATLEGNECQFNGGHGILTWDKGTSVSLVNNACTKNQIFGIYVVQRSEVVANGNVCTRNKESGFVVSGAGSRAAIVGSLCLGNNLSDKGDHGGIVFRDGAEGEVTSCTCDSNTHGILVKGPGASARLRDNTCRRNEASGIDFTNAAPGNATGNRCDENMQGITVYGTEVTLEGNTLERNTLHGVFLGGRGTGKLSGNRCEENEKSGIHVTDMGTSAELRKNTCTSNGTHGIEFARGAGGTADGNDCSENKGFGIAAFHSSTRPTLRNNRCTNNGRAGIGEEEGAAPVVESNNTLSGNGP